MNRRSLLVSIPALLLPLGLEEEGHATTEYTFDASKADFKSGSLIFNVPENAVWVGDHGKITFTSGLTDEDIEACQEHLDELIRDPGYEMYTNYPIYFLMGEQVDLYDGEDEYVGSVTDRIHYLPDASPEDIDRARAAMEARALALKE